MKLIEFRDGHNTELYINPEKVTHIMHYRPGLTYVFFDAAKAETQSKIVVQGDVKEIADKLQK